MVKINIIFGQKLFADEGVFVSSSNGKTYVKISSYQPYPGYTKNFVLA